MVRKKPDESICPYCKRPKALNKFMCDKCQEDILNVYRKPQNIFGRYK